MPRFWGWANFQYRSGPFYSIEIIRLPVLPKSAIRHTQAAAVGAFNFKPAGFVAQLAHDTFGNLRPDPWNRTKFYASNS
jgi:hypothetical protein